MNFLKILIKTIICSCITFFLLLVVSALFTSFALPVGMKMPELMTELMRTIFWVWMIVSSGLILKIKAIDENTSAIRLMIFIIPSIFGYFFEIKTKGFHEIFLFAVLLSIILLTYEFFLVTEKQKEKDLEQKT